MRTMKFRKLAVLAASALLLASCAQDPATWSAGPNPLETPETFVSPPAAMGSFGPHAEYYSRESLAAASNP